jgi:hypothetical protein
MPRELITVQVCLVLLIFEAAAIAITISVNREFTKLTNML